MQLPERRAAVPAAHGGARPAVRLRCATPSSDEPGAQEQLREPRGVEHVPGPARPPARSGTATTRCSGSSCSASSAGSSPSMVTKLHLRAADWYESNGSPAMALEHLLNTTERDRCVQLVTAAGPADLPGRPDVDRAAVAVDARRRPLSRSYPPLAVLAGWIAVLTGQTAEAQRWAAIVDAASFDLVPVDGTASFDSARAMLRAVMCAAGPEQMMADASFARRRRSRRGARGATRRCACAPRRSCSPATSTGPLPCSRRRPPLAARSRQHRLARPQRVRARVVGDGSRAMGGGGRARASWRSPPSMSTGCTTTPLSVLAFAAAARLAVHRGDLKEADRQLTRAMRARPSCTFVLPWLAVRVRLQLAKVYCGHRRPCDRSAPAAGDRRHPAPPAGARRARRRGRGVPRDRSPSSTRREPTGGDAPDARRSFGCCPTCRPTSRSARSASGCSSPATPSAPRSARSTGSSGVSSRGDAVPQATTIGLLGG